jgi:hypothetical protein
MLRGLGLNSSGLGFAGLGIRPGSGGGTSFGSGTGTSIGPGIGTSVGIGGIVRGGGPAGGASRGNPGIKCWSAFRSCRQSPDKSNICSIVFFGLAQNGNRKFAKYKRIIGLPPS